ncbi:PIR Superfamily Protein [Plasmodium ovale wallikeri]|uniref:Plasmodium vivax Vir protein, putative n=2 Tax=Plasmodium ovale TaxID=36330 RepID=A0A1C3KL02_PLAOA|nr:PIR Superfamily Protein [Plasmodium ovale wallikeri]SBT74647.1 Plasmodium vivax Vir protein, putative [Plasmodium ovale]
MEDQSPLKYVLPTNEIYKHFSEKNIDFDNHSKECEVIKTQFSAYNDLHNLCGKLINNLKEFCTKDGNDNFVKYNCTYLHYWVNDQIIKILKTTDYSIYYPVIIKFYMTWEEIIKTLTCEKYKCTTEGGPLITLDRENFLFRKKLYDYFYNYKKIEETTFSIVYKDEEPCKYLLSIQEEMENLKRECGTSSNKCPSDLNFENYNPKTLLDTLQCKEKPVSREPYDDAKEQGISGGHSGEDSERINEVMGNVSTSSDSSVKPIYISIVSVSFFGLLFLGFFLRKSNNLGLHLMRHIPGKKENITYVDDETEKEISSHYFEFEDNMSSNTRYDIAYHPA